MTFYVLRNHLRNIPWEDIFRLSDSAAASGFCDLFQVVIDVYIPHRKYQVNPHSFSWFSAVFAAAIVYRNYFCLYQQNKTFESKIELRQPSNFCKRVLKAAKHAHGTKTKESIISQKHGSQDFWGIANSVRNKGESAIPLLFNAPEVLLLLLLTKVFAKNSSKNSNLDDTGISLFIFPSKSNLKLHNIQLYNCITYKMVELDS